MALSIRFIQQGDARDLDEAVEPHCQALQSLATDDPNHSIVLDNLAAVLWLRFREHHGQRDIDEAIHLHGEEIKNQDPFQTLQPECFDSQSSSCTGAAVWNWEGFG
jgi:hypothetical protein